MIIHQILFIFAKQRLGKDNKMFQLNLPRFEIKIRDLEGKKQIYDILRRKFVALTPEEWVRQHFVHFLIDHKGYPTALLANEMNITINGMSRRCDTVLFAKDLTPLMIIEYKAPTVTISKHTFEQINAYNSILHVPYVIATNGLSHYCCHIDYNNNEYTFLEEIPEYKKIVSQC